MDPVKVKIQGRASSPGTAMVLFGTGTAIGTAMAYVVDKMRQPHADDREPDHHLVQRGLPEMILGGAVLVVAGREAFRYMRNL